jgi:hypothetical protein
VLQPLIDEGLHAEERAGCSGMYHALVEARVPFEMVHEGLLDAEHTRPFKTLILPNVAALSDAQCQQLRDFVRRGGSLIANAVAWATDEEPPVSVAGPGILDVTVWEQASSVTVHLVNLTNPMMMKGPIRELIPVGEQVVRLRLPPDRDVAGVHLLRAGVDPPVRHEPGAITVRVTSVLDHEVVAVDLR